jgi:transposase-like protein
MDIEALNDNGMTEAEWQRIERFIGDGGLRCPDCGSYLFSHNPLEDSDYICNACGYHFNT